ncbi:hypothetical protein QBC46DRAFT_336852 [Diplogelasinospora grovesii]|uniref:Uncharacterized protein n=1 Tax=Diplogelasinospora grovesii TaxID=303347 RepID=A0AAN6S940_9PEZI|nr:hypothetical protein QBC46DRAFT_336852 [Diplogelasinospora grovesii]
MRFSWVLALSSGLVSSVAATGSRGGAERAAYFITYLMEEIYTDSSKFTIAAGCVGSRTGLGGQKGRCSLLELCDYLWIDRQDPETGAKLGDTKPVLENVSMNKKMDQLSNLDAGKIMNGIMSAWEMVGGQKVILNNVKHGYVGGTDPEKLMGVTDWYQANQKVGDSMREAMKEIAANDKTGKFSKWPAKAIEASNLVIDLRVSDANQVALDRTNGITKYAGGRPILSKPYTKLSTSIQGNIKMVDREGTIKAWQSDITQGGTTFPALSEADATSTFDNAVTHANNSDGNRHKMAIEAAMESDRRMRLSC